MPAVDATALLSVNNLSCSKSQEQAIFSGVSFDVYAGDILVLTGRSGSGKTTLLKCLSHLNIYQGEISLYGRKPVQYGIPQYRTLVQYVPQRPSLLPATPHDFIKTIASYASRNSVKRKPDASPWRHLSYGSIYSLSNGVNPGDIHGPLRIAEQWGIDEDLWHRPWASLSGGEAQRIALAVAIGISGGEVLLLDEPTSALDAESTARVEKTLRNLVEDENSTVKAIIWITHSTEQARRVGTRFLSLEDGGCLERMELGLTTSESSNGSATATTSVVPNIV